MTDIIDDRPVTNDATPSDSAPSRPRTQSPGLAIVVDRDAPRQAEDEIDPSSPKTMTSINSQEEDLKEETKRPPMITLNTESLKDCVAPPADYFTIVFCLVLMIWIVPMIGSPCFATCAPPDWSFTGYQLVAALGLWVIFFGNGLLLIWRSATSDVDGRRQRLGVWRAKSGPYVTYVSIVLNLLQCIFFIIRTITKRVYLYGMLIELLALTVMSIEFTSAYLTAHAMNTPIALKFMFSDGINFCLLVMSILLVPIIELNGQKTWFSLSFLGATHFNAHFVDLLEVRKIDVFSVKGQMLISVSSVSTTIFAAAMAIMSLENLGDPTFMEPFNQGEWNVVSALYFMVSTMATVGYGDLVPVTTFGRMVAIFAVFSGVGALSATVLSVMKLRALHSTGTGRFAPPARAKHIVIAGNPSPQMAIEFLQEIFHADHDEKAEDLRACFLFPKSSTALLEVRAFMKLKSNIRIAPRVTLLSGNVLDSADLARCYANKADRVFLLPDPWAADPTQEDTENVVRMMAIRRSMKHLRIVLLLLKAERLGLLRDAGMSSGVQAALTTSIAFDQFKMEMVGKSCIVPGFSTLVCNLCKTIGEEEDESLPTWRQEYDRGSGNELYEVELSQAYALRGAQFSEVVLDVLNQSEGVVYLIGLVETRPDGFKRILLNPGPRYPIKNPKTRVNIQGIFVAPDHGAIVQCEAGTVFLGRRERPAGDKDKLKTVADVTRPVDISGKHRQIIDESLLQRGLNKTQAKQARELVTLAKLHADSAHPPRPPAKMLATGGHIVVLCVGADFGFRGGIEHFVQPLRDKVATSMPPVVILAPVVPADWHTVVGFKKIYFMEGSPLATFDLERACVKLASAVFVCHASSSMNRLAEPWMADSEVLCVTRLVESQLDPDATTLVICEVASEDSHRFIPLTSSKATSGVQKSRLSMNSMSSMGSSAEKQSSVGGDGGEDDGREEEDLHEIANDEYFKQPRYACGQLFVGSVVTALAANTYYAPSLSELVSTMINSRVQMIKVTREWIGKTYGEYFDQMLWAKELLALGLYRQGEYHPGSKLGGGGDRKHTLRYVYTTPPGQQTIMLETDLVICLSTSAFVLPSDFGSNDATEAIEDSAGVVAA